MSNMVFGMGQNFLFEFKNNIADLNIVLVQAVHYLSKLRNKGGIQYLVKLS